MWNVPKILETYATIIPMEYITSMFKFLCIKPLIPAFKIGRETYKNGAILTINESSPIEDMLIPAACLMDWVTPPNGSHPLNIKIIKIAGNIVTTPSTNVLNNTFICSYR